MTSQSQNLSAIDISMTYVKHWKGAVIILLLFLALGIYHCISYQKIHFGTIIASGEKLQFVNIRLLGPKTDVITEALAPPSLVVQPAQPTQQNLIMLNNIFIPRAIASYQKQHHSTQQYAVTAEQLTAHTGIKATPSVFLYQLKASINPSQQAAYTEIFDNISQQFIDYQNQVTDLSITLTKNQQDSIKNQIAYLTNPQTIKILTNNQSYHRLVSHTPTNNNTAATQLTLQSLAANLQAELKNTEAVLATVNHAAQVMPAQLIPGTSGPNKLLILIISLFLGFIFATIYVFAMELIINTAKNFKNL